MKILSKFVSGGQLSAYQGESDVCGPHTSGEIISTVGTSLTQSSHKLAMATQRLRAAGDFARGFWRWADVRSCHDRS